MWRRRDRPGNGKPIDPREEVEGKKYFHGVEKFHLKFLHAAQIYDVESGDVELWQINRLASLILSALAAPAEPPFVRETKHWWLTLWSPEEQVWYQVKSIRCHSMKMWELNYASGKVIMKSSYSFCESRTFWPIWDWISHKELCSFI